MLSIKPLSFKPPKLRGLPRAQLDNAYERHYGPALQAHNALSQRVEAAHGEANANRAVDLQQELARKAVEVSLFECYFQGLTDEDTGAPSPELEAAINSTFGSDADFRSRLKSEATGYDSGWLTLTKRDSDNVLNIGWTSADAGVPVDHSALMAIPLQIDVREHAFTDGSDAYIDAVLSNVSWSMINRRFAGLPVMMDKNRSNCMHLRRYLQQ